MGPEDKIIQYVVRNNTIQVQREELMEQMHSSLLSGHLMYDKTLYKVKQRFFWPNLNKDLHEFIKSCSKCQKAQNPRIRPKGGLQPIIVNRPLE